MPTRKTMKDQYANVLYDTCTESAANTLTFEQVDVGLNIFDKVGLLVSRIEYTKWWDQLVDDADVKEWGISASNGWASASPAETSIIDYNRVRIREVGVATTALVLDDPYVKDFSSMPGGGILIAPKPIYLFVAGSSLAAASEIQMRMYFTVIKLNTEEYFELLESRAFFS